MSERTTLSVPAPSRPLSLAEVESQLRRAMLFAARLQLYTSSALVWLIFIFSTVSEGIPPLAPAIVLSAWIIGTTLLLNYFALRGDLRFLAGPLPGRVALFTTLLTVLLATVLIRDVAGDFYLIYFFPVVVATIYYGLRGGLPTALLCAVSYAALVLLLNPTLPTSALLSLLAGRAIFLLALTGAIGVSVEGRLTLTRELQRAYGNLQTAVRSLEETRATLDRRIEEAATLDRVAREITATLDVEKVLRLVLEEVEVIMGAEASTLMTLDANANELVFQIPLGAKGAQLQGFRMPVGKGVAGWVAQHGAPLRVDDTTRDTRHFQSVDQQSGFQTRSILCVPMKLQARVTGVLEVMNKKEGVFTAADERLLTAVAQWAAIALENATLYGDLQKTLEALKKAQEHLIRVERLRALGEMAGGVAHDFNNLLTIILAESQLLRARTRDPREDRSLLRIERAARDAAQAVRRIQEYTRVRRDAPQEIVDVNDLVKESVEITRPRWEPLADIVLHLEPTGAVAGNSAELREVLTNLIFNAVDARVEERRCQITIRATCWENKWALISVQDNGSGIPAELQAKIFDPYFTTKAHGTGLGLSVAFGIIQRHGGHIQVESPVPPANGHPEQAGGTRFEIRLPLTTRLAELETMPKPTPARRFARILFIDDDPNVLAAASSLLDAIGYQVLIAQTAAEAESQISAGQYDVLMTDLTMPEKSGWDLAHRAKKLWRDKPVVLVTGWGLQLDAKEMATGSVDGVLTKPFTIDDLEQTLNDLANQSKRK